MVFCRFCKWAAVGSYCEQCTYVRCSKFAKSRAKCAKKEKKEKERERETSVQISFLASLLSSMHVRQRCLERLDFRNRQKADGGDNEGKTWVGDKQTDICARSIERAVTNRTFFIIIIIILRTNERTIFSPSCMNNCLAKITIMSYCRCQCVNLTLNISLLFTSSIYWKIVTIGWISFNIYTSVVYEGMLDSLVQSTNASFLV